VVPAPRAQRDRRAQGQQAQQGGQAPLEPPGAGKKWMETMETLPKHFQNEGFTMFHLLCGFDDLILWFSHQKVW
jgi:hypothetical protein